MLEESLCWERVGLKLKKKKMMMIFKDREKIGILGDFGVGTKVFLTTWIFYIRSVFLLLFICF